MLGVSWVVVKELRLCYHNGYIYIYMYIVITITSPHYSNLN